MPAVLLCRRRPVRACLKCGLLAVFTTVLLLPISAEQLPAGTRLEARLSVATGSRISKPGDPITATIIAPVSVQGRIVVPQGATLLGRVAAAHALGLGLKRSTASLSYDFSTLRYPNGVAVPLNTQLADVETAKEHVDRFGTVHGIHPIASLSSNLSFYLFPLLVVNPAVGIPIWAIKSVVAPSANPEIYFPVGTEVTLRLTTQADVPQMFDNVVRIKPLSPGAKTDITRLLKISPSRAYLGSHPSDAVNVVLIGSPQAMNRAFQAAGWVPAQRKSPMALYRMYHALCYRHGYSNAPMNTLTLNGAPPAFVRQKSLDTVEKRHHVRFWQEPGEADVWLGTAAEDAGFRFERTHWTHVIHLRIDNERAKVVNDLAFTGCVETAGLLSRPRSDFNQNARAKRAVITDGKVAVVQLNSCHAPETMAGVGQTPTGPPREWVTRGMSAFRRDLIRSNIFFTAYNTMKLFGRKQGPPVAGHASVINAETRDLNWLSVTDPAIKASGMIVSASSERQDLPE